MGSASSIYAQLQKLSNEATKKTLEYNQKEANTARAWQKEMSNTSHQREVTDLIKAGLNPVLSSNQGAQSYTTSAASGQAENAANAVANAYGADRSAAATKAAAASSAAATRYAADQNLRAAQAAAYANMYSADKHYEGQRYSADKQYKTAMDKPAGNWSSLLDKYMQKSGYTDTVLGRNDVKNAISWAGKYFGNPKAAFNDVKSRFTSPYASLNNPLKDKVNLGLSKLHIDANRRTRNLYVDAVLNGDKKSWDKLMSFVPKEPTTSYGSARSWNRTGSGVW